MIHIYPSIPLGGAIDGMLDFSPEGVEKRITQGYDDAKAVLVEKFGPRLFFTRMGRPCGMWKTRYVEPRILNSQSSDISRRSSLVR